MNVFNGMFSSYCCVGRRDGRWICCGRGKRLSWVRAPIEPNRIEFSNSLIRFDSIINIKVNSIQNSTKFDRISNFIEL